MSDLPRFPAHPAADDGGPGLRVEEIAALDDAEELARYTRFEGPPGTPSAACSRLRLDGLHCAACAGLIEQALLRVPGVREARVNGAARRAQVIWHPGEAKASDLFSAVQGAGYRAFPDTGADDQAVHDLQAVESKRGLWRLFVAAFCMMQVMMYATPTYVASPADIGADTVRLLYWASWLLSLPVVLFAATPFYRGAWSALRQGRIGMDVPVVLGILVTFAASTAVAFGGTGQATRWGHEVYFDSLTMFVAFLLTGRALEQRARRRATAALDSALNRLPSAVERRVQASPVQGPDRPYNDRQQAPGSDLAGWEWVTPARLHVGDELRIAVGQAFAADGVLVEGQTEVDEALLTGESRALSKQTGDGVLAGSYNLARPVVMRITRLGPDTRYERIVQLIGQAVGQKPRVVQQADRLAGPFLWAVLLLALLGGLVWTWIDADRALWVAVAVWVVTCPCALSLAAPSALVAAAGALARRGLLVRRLEALEALAQADLVVFDKTGTLTDERPRVVAAHLPAGVDREALWRRVVGLAAHSQHPLSRALVEAGPEPAHGEDRLGSTWTDVREVPGAGIEGRDPHGRRWRLGSAAWTGVDAHQAAQAGIDPGQARVWFLCLDDRTQAGVGFEIDERLRPDAAQAIAALRAAGLEVMLLSGDQPARVRGVADQLGIDRAVAAASPEDKLATIEREQRAGRRVVVVGDGINDAPVLARANVSFAMGHGAALSQARADVLVLGSRPADVVWALFRARLTMRVIRQNLWWALGYNLIGLPLALAGWLPPWLAGLGMALSSLVVVLNALRAGRAETSASSNGRQTADATLALAPSSGGG